MCVDAECNDWWYADKVTADILRCRKGHFWAPDFVPKEFLKFLPGYKQNDIKDKEKPDKPEQYDIGSEADIEEKTVSTAAAATDQEEDKKKFENLSRSIRTNQEGGWESPPGLLEEHERLRKRLSPEEQEKTEEPSIASFKRKADKLGVAAKKAKQNVIDNLEKRQALLRSLEDNERNQKVFEKEEAEAVRVHQDALDLHAKKNKEANAEKDKKEQQHDFKEANNVAEKVEQNETIKELQEVRRQMEEMQRLHKEQLQSLQAEIAKGRGGGGGGEAAAEIQAPAPMDASSEEDESEAEPEGGGAADQKAADDQPKRRKLTKQKTKKK